MAGQMVYGDPFGAALSGKRAALDDVLRAGTVAREQRNTDLGYDFNKWYQPVRQAEAQNDAGTKLLHTAALNAHYTGDLRPLNQVLQGYFGQAPGALPQEYQSGRATPGAQRSADLAFGALPPAFAYPDVAGAGGDYRAIAALPGSTTPQDPELAALTHAATVKRLNDYLNGGAAAMPTPVPHLSPYGNVPIPGAAPHPSTAVPTGAYTPYAPPQAPTGIFDTPGPDAHPSVGDSDGSF